MAAGLVKNPLVTTMATSAPCTYGVCRRCRVAAELGLEHRPPPVAQLGDCVGPVIFRTSGPARYPVAFLLGDTGDEALELPGRLFVDVP